ncbi:hypothetical protein N7490_008063 [Penicillium lividum]|nr:hypothetical protein N7490_008063 [Penicillium lividum]
MDIKHEFGNMHLMAKGGYIICIVVKVARVTEPERQQFRKEIEIYKTLSLSMNPAPSLVDIKVDRLVPLRLQLEWINSLAQAIAFLESFDLAHGDLRPDNILLDGDTLQVTDFTMLPTSVHHFILA